MNQYLITIIISLFVSIIVSIVGYKIAVKRFRKEIYIKRMTIAFEQLTEELHKMNNAASLVNRHYYESESKELNYDRVWNAYSPGFILMLDEAQAAYFKYSFYLDDEESKLISDYFDFCKRSTGRIVVFMKQDSNENFRKLISMEERKEISTIEKSFKPESLRLLEIIRKTLKKKLDKI